MFSENEVYLAEFRFCDVQVVLTPTHLAIVMEYAAGGELFERICNAGRFSEDEVFLAAVSSYFWSFSYTEDEDWFLHLE